MLVRGKTSWALAALSNPAALFLCLLLFTVNVSAGTVNLEWDPVVDPALTGYRIHHGPAEGNYTVSIDVGNTTVYAVTNLTEGATYHFAVTAYDSSLTQSGYSNDVSATIPYVAPVADFSASSVSGPAPLAMNFIDNSTGTIDTYAWTFGDGTTSNVRNPAHTYSVAGVYTVGLTIIGPGGTSTLTRPNYVTVFGALDTSPPTTPSGLDVVGSDSFAINLIWIASSDNVGVTAYLVERCQGPGCTDFVQIASIAGTWFSDPNVIPGTTYRYRVRAADAVGNLSGYSAIVMAPRGATVDTLPPTAPSSLLASANGSSTIDLTWSASSDNVGVTGYRVERCEGVTCTDFSEIAAPTATNFSNTGLLAGTTYRYRVRANDEAGNLSGYSAIAAATTVVAADTSPPTIPSGVDVVLSDSFAINLIWIASSDNVGVTAYLVERCEGPGCTDFVQIASIGGTWFSDPNVIPGTTYRYRVRAADGAANLSGYSATTTVPR